MKTKIFLILIIIIFAVSCTKNNPVNPVNVSNNGQENIRIEIYDDCIEVYRASKYFRFDITKQDNKYNLEKYKDLERHTLNMTINGNTASVTYTITVQGHKNENYYFHSNSLTKKQ